MQNKPLIAVCIIAVVILVLTSFPSVVGFLIVSGIGASEKLTTNISAFPVVAGADSDENTHGPSLITSDSNGIGLFVLHGRIIYNGEVEINGYLCYNLTAIRVRGFYFHYGLPIPQITIYKYINEPLYLYKEGSRGFVSKNYMFYWSIGYA